VVLSPASTGSSEKHKTNCALDNLSPDQNSKRIPPEYTEYPRTRAHILNIFTEKIKRARKAWFSPHNSGTTVFVL
jgi:hypothetical protein